MRSYINPAAPTVEQDALVGYTFTLVRTSAVVTTPRVVLTPASHSLTLTATKQVIGVGSFVEKTIQFRDKDGAEVGGEILY